MHITRRIVGEVCPSSRARRVEELVHKRKLIEVALPLEAINRESAREKSIRHGHPSTLHLWWARRPLAAARAVLFAQLVDDPSARPEEFPTEELQRAERDRLHGLIERMVIWENLRDERLLADVRAEIMKSSGGVPPPIIDPFAGGGSIPLEAQRLGLESNASDLNPVAVLINKAQIEIPPRFRDRVPVFPGLAGSQIRDWSGGEGLAADVRAYGDWLRDEAERRIGHLYPPARLGDGTSSPVIACLWARTVTCPNPACGIAMPLVRSWWLGKKRGNEAYVVPEIVADGTVPAGQAVRFVLKHGRAGGPSAATDGTVGRNGARCVACETSVELAFVRAEGRAGRLGQQLMGVVAGGDRKRTYLAATEDQIVAAAVDRPDDAPDAAIPPQAPSFRVQAYGMTQWSDLFTNRQLIALTTLADLVPDARAKVIADGGDPAYADAVATYLGLAVSRTTDLMNSIVTWSNSRDQAPNLFARQAIPMAWDFVEVSPFARAAGDVGVAVATMSKALLNLAPTGSGHAEQADAGARSFAGMLISTDPPYYDNIGYSDLSDFFYVWLRRSLSTIHSKTVGTMLTPKFEELVANPYRHDGKAGAEKFFIEGFNSVFARVREGADPNVPLTVYYAYKQQEANAEGTSSTGWHTLLDGLIDSGWEITATWPMRTEMSGRLIGSNANALASSIVLACRPRPSDAPTTTRRAFVAALKAELPEALRTLMQGAIAPVDLAQAAIGPGISVFSRYSRVREADGSDMSVKDALLLVNATLDEVIGEQESDFDPDTRFAVKWYRQYGWTQENSGIADQLARSSDTSIGALERGGIFEAKGGKARLLSPTQLEGAWDVSADERVSVWEATVRLAAVMAKHGADQVASLLPSVQTRVNLDAVKELGFLLFHEAEKKRDTKDAILFNGLVSAWGDVNEQARKHAGTPRAVQQAFDFDEDGD